jgi:hypothetical protein
MCAGFALLLMHTLLHWNMIVVWFVWVVCLDTPHFFGTYYRTYLDNQEWHQRRGLLLGSLAVFLVGPAMLGAAAGLHALGTQNFTLPWRLWGTGVSLWAYLHITRQHFGFLRLYNRKNGEIGSVEAWLDKSVLYGFLALCFVGLLLSHPLLRGNFGLAPQMAPLPANFWAHPLASASTLTWDRWFFLGAEIGAGGLAVILTLFQAGKLMRGEAINIPKLIFLGTIMLLHGVISFSGLLPAYTLLAFTAIITIYHDIQYLSIVWFYSRKHYAPGDKKHGLAGVLAKRFTLFFGAALLLASLPIWGLGCIINRVSVCGPGTDAGSMTFMGDTTWTLFFVILTSSIQMHHYVLDMFIWRPGKNADLRRDLGLEPAG